MLSNTLNRRQDHFACRWMSVLTVHILTEGNMNLAYLDFRWR